jgi:hypothetical protein
MRVGGGLLVALGALLIFIVGAWGRSGYYASQAPIMLLLIVAGLISLGVGAALLRYQKSRFTAAATAVSSVTQRAFAASTPVAIPEAPAIVVPADAIDEKTRDRVLPASDWALLLPDGTILPVADALVIGRQPVSSDGGPTAAVPSALVSKSQARFRILGGRLGVRDLDSTNGTIVVHPDETEERVSSVDETALSPGDRLEIGSYALEVRRMS